MRRGGGGGGWWHEGEPSARLRIHPLVAATATAHNSGAQRTSCGNVPTVKSVSPLHSHRFTASGLIDNAFRFATPPSLSCVWPRPEPGTASGGLRAFAVGTLMAAFQSGPASEFFRLWR
jgi:hypothetical protein